MLSPTTKNFVMSQINTVETFLNKQTNAHLCFTFHNWMVQSSSTSFYHRFKTVQSSSIDQLPGLTSKNRRNLLLQVEGCHIFVAQSKSVLVVKGEIAPFPFDFTKFQQIVLLQNILVLREKKIRNRPSCSNPYTRRVLSNFLKVVRATRTEVQRFKQHFLHKIIGTHNLPTAHLYFLPASKLLQLTWFWQEYTLQFLFLSTPLRLNIPFLSQFHPKQMSMFVNTVSILD